MSLKNEKVFLSYAWTGEDQASIKARMSEIAKILKDAGVDYYFNQEDSATTSFTRPGQFVCDAIQKIELCSAMLVIKSTDRRSEGQLMEIGAALASGKRVILLQQESTVGTTYLDDSDLAAETIVWNTEEELLKVIGGLV